MSVAAAGRRARTAERVASVLLELDVDALERAAGRVDRDVERAGLADERSGLSIVDDGRPRVRRPKAAPATISSCDDDKEDAVRATEQARPGRRLVDGQAAGK